jgi:hypothetical protein
MIRPAGEVSRRRYHDCNELSRGVVHRMKMHLEDSRLRCFKVIRRAWG